MHSTQFLPPSSMPVDQNIALTCLIEGESSVFRVRPKGNIDMIDLRSLIKEERKNNVLRDVDAADLKLWKVRMIMGQRYHN